MAGLSRADVEHVAHLARLGLTDDELALLEGQLNHILDQYAKLAELTPTTSRRRPRRSSSRTSSATTSCTPSLPVEAVLANASDAVDGYIVVPAILGAE